MLFAFYYSDDAERSLYFFFLRLRRPPRSTLFPYTPLFRSNGVSDCGGRGGLRGCPVLLDLPPLLLLDRRPIAQADAPRLRTDLDDLEIILLARLERACALQRPGGGAMHCGGTFVAPPPFFDLRVMAKGLDVFTKFHERSERGDSRNLALHNLPDLVALEPLAPNVVDLLDAQRHPPVLRIDFQHFRGDRLALLENFVGILDPPGPAHVAHVHQAVESILDFDERSKLRDVAHLPGDHRSDGILIGNLQPRIRLSLLDSQRHSPIARLDVQHHYVDFFPYLHQL